MNKTKQAGIYLHIPFCMEKCRYCDFYSFPHMENEFDRYENRLIECLEYYKERYARDYNSLYFGGGTPLYMGEKHLVNILSHAHDMLSKDSEITAEGNPTTADGIDFALLREGGFNRLSFGLQSTDERELFALGRRHTATDAKNTVLSARRAGFDNISLDLMLGIPYQTVESLSGSIDFCADLGITHISAYMLKIEEGTPLAKSEELRSLCAGDDELCDLYLFAAERLESLGYHQYEISNFAKDGYESRHNLKYWLDEEYIGLGPSAHSYMEGRRFYFGRNYRDFMDKPFDETEKYEGEGGSAEEYAMLRLRLTRGLDTALMKELYPKTDTNAILQRAGLYEKAGLLRISGENISFTPKGMAVSNSLTAEILYP